MPTPLHSRSATLGGPGPLLAGPHAPTQSNAPSTAWCRRLNTSCDAPTRWAIPPVNTDRHPFHDAHWPAASGLLQGGLAMPALPPASRQPLTGLSLALSAPWCESHRGFACSELQPKCSHASWAAGYGPQRHKTCPRPCGQPASASSRLVSSFQLFQLLLLQL
ncbi:hypothetical protein BGZ61DRAFT_53682 [Ilyonectria robusta]|uniref:uncharacterized protein n=1 Tax=Ilyonectria robusta TaxID=1079257 RepID=UPI001E8CC2EA|nr:uncharacterized protein BGZ61DRAFT_53682 [Ilyonectria robusta]KAH8686568.1 hypothetical protein BGZ61DRAFT_53682 [Ilyonectria robusta]